MAMGLTAVAQVGELPRSTPEAEGVDSNLLKSLYLGLQARSDVDIHHIMVLRQKRSQRKAHIARTCNCDLIQGFSMGEPFTEDEFIDFYHGNGDI